jgi:hypothetical protein
MYDLLGHQKEQAYIRAQCTIAMDVSAASRTTYESPEVYFHTSQTRGVGLVGTSDNLIYQPHRFDEDDSVS